jgi:indole-3-glycerol phosphate synthase
MSVDFLADMAESSRARVREARAACSESELLARAQGSPEAPRLSLSVTGFDLLAELKLRSPALGQLQSGAPDIAGRVLDYADAGAVAVSVLTEPSRLDGSLHHLQIAVQALTGRIPVMRKDFIVDPYQIMEARALGAGGVLVILRMLPEVEILKLLDTARMLRLFVLLEAFDEADLVLAASLLRTHQHTAEEASAPLLVGLNSRDLVSLQVVPDRLQSLASKLPAAAPRVAESGIVTADDARRVAAAGYDVALVGGALMTAPDPRAALVELLEAGRSVRARPVSAENPG